MLQDILDVRLPSLAAAVSPHLPTIRTLVGKSFPLGGVTLDASFPNAEERHCRLLVKGYDQVNRIAFPDLEESLRAWIGAFQHYWRFRGAMFDMNVDLASVERKFAKAPTLGSPKALIEAILDAPEVVTIRQGLVDGTLDFGTVKRIGPQAVADGPHRMSFFLQARRDEHEQLVPFEIGFYVAAVRVDHPVVVAATAAVTPRIQPLAESWLGQPGWDGVSYLRLTLPLNPRLERALGRGE